MADAGPHPGDVPPDPDRPGGAAPRQFPPMRRRPAPAGAPTPAQARFVARAGLVLTLLLAAAGIAGVLWAVLAAVGIVR